MKKTTLLPILLTALAIGFVGCDKHDHDHDHDHDGDGHADHDASEHDHEGEHDHDDGHAHGEDGDHVHEKGEAGPNGGRIITSVDPAIEFFVTDGRKVQITFLGTDHKTAVFPGTQTVSLIAGDRSNPTMLAFTRNGKLLLSDGALPEGDDFPTVLEIRPTPDAEPTREKFNLDLSDCPTCEFREYACICDHGDHDH